MDVDDVSEIGCEIRSKGSWERVTLSAALRLDSSRIKRCPECHGQLRIRKAVVRGVKISYFEHYEPNPGCSFGDCFDGTRRPHPKALT